MLNPLPDSSLVIDATRKWLEVAVIGLNLCPFAKAVHVHHQIRYVASSAKNTEMLAEELATELTLLAATDPGVTDTTLLIHPLILGDFLEYNDFLERAQSVLKDLKLDGVLQIASFHPRYQFADSGPDDIENYTNRSPFPTLHLLRESSIDRAVEAYPDAAKIFRRNMATLVALGKAGWDALALTPVTYLSPEHPETR